VSISIDRENLTIMLGVRYYFSSEAYNMVSVKNEYGTVGKYPTNFSAFHEDARKAKTILLDTVSLHMRIVR
jgi:hypothetical protein